YQVAISSLRTRSWWDRESVFSWLMLAPPLLFLAAFVGYPFCYGIFLSLQERPIAKHGVFVGLQNFATELKDHVYWRGALNTSVYTGIATLVKAVGGLGLALVHDHAAFLEIARCDSATHP